MANCGYLSLYDGPWLEFRTLFKHWRLSIRETLVKAIVSDCSKLNGHSVSGGLVHNFRSRWIGQCVKVFFVEQIIPMRKHMAKGKRI